MPDTLDYDAKVLLSFLKNEIAVNDLNLQGSINSSVDRILNNNTNIKDKNYYLDSFLRIIYRHDKIWVKFPRLLEIKDELYNYITLVFCATDTMLINTCTDILCRKSPLGWYFWTKRGSIGNPSLDQGNLKKIYDILFSTLQSNSFKNTDQVAIAIYKLLELNLPPTYRQQLQILVTDNKMLAKKLDNIHFLIEKKLIDYQIKPNTTNISFLEFTDKSNEMLAQLLSSTKNKIESLTLFFNNLIEDAVFLTSNQNLLREEKFDLANKINNFIVTLLQTHHPKLGGLISHFVAESNNIQLASSFFALLIRIANTNNFSAIAALLSSSNDNGLTFNQIIA
jgi:hypothetical protein